MSAKGILYCGCSIERSMGIDDCTEIVGVQVCSQHLLQLLNCKDLNEAAEKLRKVLLAHNSVWDRIKI